MEIKSIKLYESSLAFIINFQIHFICENPLTSEKDTFHTFQLNLMPTGSGQIIGENLFEIEAIQELLYNSDLRLCMEFDCN